MTNNEFNIPPCFYRVSIKGLVVEDGKILLSLLEGNPTYGPKWELPGGGLDFGEELRTGFHREIQEELGVSVASMDERPHYLWTVFRKDSSRGYGAIHLFHVCYRITLDSQDFGSDAEAKETKFFSPEELKDLAIHPSSEPIKQHFNPSDFK